MPKKEDALATKDQQNEGALVASNFAALATNDLASVKEIIEGNFGRGQINFNDLDRVKLPSGGGITWEVITLEGATSAPELRGIIVAWADKKTWWPLSMDEGDGGPPVCRAETVWDNGRSGIGIGDPTVSLNAKEEELLKAKPGLLRVPKAAPGVQGGWDCSTCIHNQFGSNAKHGGKACGDKRAILMLDQDSLLPFIILLPSTSIQPIKEYFGRLARHGVPFFGAITSLKLEKDKSGGGITYSKVVATLVEKLGPDHMATARAYNQMLMPLLQGPAMNQPALYQQDSQQQAKGREGLLAQSMADLIQPQQITLIESLAATRNLLPDEAASACFGQPISVRELSKDAGARLIEHLKEVKVPDKGPATDQAS